MVLTAGGRTPPAAGDKVKCKPAETEVMATYVGALLLQKRLIMNPLQKCKAHSSLQFYRRRSNRFGENGLTDACRAIFSKQAAPKSHAFLFCHEPLPPGTRCGKHRRRALLAPARRRIFETQKPAAAKSACRQYRVARWFLLPEGELRPRLVTR